MKLNSCTAIVLAAGKGTRMKSRQPKVLHKILDWPLIFYPLKLLQSCGILRIIVVLGHGGKLVQNAIGAFEVEVAWQHRQLGTAHAVSCALGHMELDCTQCLIMCGDMPLMTKESLDSLIAHHTGAGCDITVLSAVFDDPTGYGRIVRAAHGAALEAIVEEKDATPEIRRIKEVNTGTYLVDSGVLRQLIALIGNENAQGEYYLTDMVRIAKDMGLSVDVCTLSEPTEALGVNSRADLAMAEGVILERLRLRHMKNGVTLVMPNTIYLENAVKIANDVVIGPFCVIKGETRIGSGVQIGPYSLIQDQVIESGAVIPPFSRLCREGI